MAVTDVNGTQTAVIGTEHTLADTSAAGTYVLRVDLSNMAAGDMVEVRIRTITLSTDTVPGNSEVYKRFYDVQSADGEKQVVSIPVSTPLSTSGAIRATLKQTAGTARTFKWSLMKFA